MTGDLHLRNARIWTGWSRQPWASRVTIRNGRIASLDADDAPPGATILDGEGGVAVPGLIDAHVHLLMGGASLDRLDLSHVRTRAAFEAAIAARHTELPTGEWLLAEGWSQEQWPSRELPDKTWLAAAGDRPVVAQRRDLHAAVVNDAVLNRIDTREDPPGGRIGRDPDTGVPTGMMIEAALWTLVNPLIPSAGAARKREFLLNAQRQAHATGLTAVGSMEYMSDVQAVYEPMRDRLTLRCRITLLDRDWPMHFDDGRDFDSGDDLAVIGYKTFLDGTLGSSSARMLADYADEPGNRGLLIELAKDGVFAEWASAVADAGMSPSIHAIGDEAVRLALDVVGGLPAEVRPRIEHAQHVDPSDLPRFRGVIASMQPLHKAGDGPLMRARLGEERLAGAYAFRGLHDAGARLAFGSDWPVVSCDPMAGIRAAVTGLTSDGEVLLPEQNLTIEQALHAYTTGAAHALGLDDAGCLRPNNLGDLTLLDRDPFTADWKDAPPSVRGTVVGGGVMDTTF
jgi:predicted amidohydrolase YtcJ